MDTPTISSVVDAAATFYRRTPAELTDARPLTDEGDAAVWLAVEYTGASYADVAAELGLGKSTVGDAYARADARKGELKDVDQAVAEAHPLPVEDD